MADIKFKSAGTLRVDKIANDSLSDASGFVPIGIRTPLRFGTASVGVFAMHTSLIEQIDDNLRNLIQTNHGERLGLYDFGANLQPLMTELVASETFESDAMASISTAVSRYMPYVALETFESAPDAKLNTNIGAIAFTITYGVPSLGVSGRKLKILLYVT